MLEPAPHPRPRRRRLRRILWIAVVVVVILPVLVVLGTLLALRAGGVRQAILARISGLLAAEYGLAFAARDFSPQWLSRGVELRDVRLGAPGAAPLAAAARVRVTVDLGSLRRRPLVVRTLAADGLRIDLAAPFPEIPESPAEAEAGPPVEIRRIVVRDGEIRGAPVVLPAAAWVRSWNLRQIEARGRYRAGRLELEIQRGEALLDWPGFGLQALQLAGRVGYEEKRPLRVDGLRVTGDGLRLAASGSVGLEQGAPTTGRFELYAEPRLLTAGVPPRGSLRASGRLALPENAGEVKLTAVEIPAEALKPYVDATLYADLALAGTVADVEADLVLGPGDWGRVTGTAEAVWRRGLRPFARVEARLAPAAAAPIVAVLSAELLPQSPGRRFLHGTVRARSWAELAGATADDLRAEIRLPEVRTALAEARALWPRLVPAPPEGVPLAGSLTAQARIAGALASPDAELDATWLPRPGSRVDVQAKGRPIGWSGSATARLESVPLEMLGALVPGLAGSVSGTADLAGTPRGYQTRVAAITTALALPPNLQRLESAALNADGRLVLAPLSYRGALAVHGTGLAALPNASDTARIASFELTGDGFFQASPVRWEGRLTLDGDGGEMAGVGRLERFRVESEGVLGKEALDLAGRAEADRAVLAEQEIEIRNLRLEGEADGHEVRLAALSGEIPEGRTFSAAGRVVTEPLLAEAELDLELVRPVDAVSAADLGIRLRDGVVEVDAHRIESASGPGTLRARLPLAALRDVPQLAAALEALPGEKAQGPVSVSLAFPALDSEPLFAALGMAPRPERIRTGVTADLVLDLAAPAAGRGEVRLTGLTLAAPDGRITAEGPAVLRLADGRVSLEPVHLRVDGGAVQGAGIDLEASAELARSWRPFTDPVSAAITRVAAAGSGTIDAALLNPYLEGGAAEGSLAFTAQASGSLERLDAAVDASGPGASFFWPAAAVQIEDPRLGLDLRDGRWTIREGRMAVNGGRVDLGGGYSTERGVDLEAQLADVRYRLDYGIDTLLSGRLTFRSPPEGRSRLSGRVIVDRGVLNRDLNLDREVFTLLFEPPETTGTEESALAAVDLDLAVETTEGVRIKNNVGDLRASWRRLDVGGTLEEPVIRGRIDIDPGGRFLAYGQTVRIDRGALVFTGDPVNDPQVDLLTTTSIQDPTILQLQGDGPLDLLRSGEERRQGPATADLLSGGLTSYYGARFVERLGRPLGLGGFSVRPTLELDPKEADPSARLTVGRELSRSVTVALSVDLRNAERQTYLLNLHELRSLPGLWLEGLTRDDGEEVATLQQVLSFGGGQGERQATGPRLRRIRISTPKKGVSKREIRRALGLEKRALVPAGTAFAAEVDAADLLRRKGYPGPRIEAAVKPVASRPGWVDLAVTVEPGPKVSFVFAGDRPPRALRPEITGLYRTDFYEPNAIAEMRQAAVRAFRATGHLDPEIEIDVVKERPEDPDGPRTVTIRAAAGRRQSLQALEIAGVNPEEERLLVGAFASPLARAELAAGQPNADRRLLDLLRALGYPEAGIASRAVGADGSRLTVTIAAGPRRTLSSIELAGVEGAERERLLRLLTLRAGDPVRRDRIVLDELALERDLTERGFADAVVRSSVVPLPADPGKARLVFDVAPGPRVRLAAVELEGGRWSRSRLFLRETGLAAGAPFRAGAVEEARSRLLRTGVFSRVDAEVARAGEGEARVTFSLAERPRFRLGYGVRWESEVGTSAVLTFEDRNFVGRAMTLGVRGLYEPDDRSGRLYLRTGAVLGSRISLESFAEQRRRLFPDENLIEDRRELSLQASRPLGETLTARLYARHRTTHLFEMEADPFFPFDLELRLPLLGAQLLYDTRDDPIDPRAGIFASLDVSGSGGFLGSDFEYVRSLAQASSFRDFSLAGRPFTWAQSVRVGVAQPFGGQELIRQERFFAGGPFSVRGYAMEGLGPREILGDLDRALGGEALLVVNQELRLALPWDLTGLVFLDAGQIWGRLEDADFDLATALGLGLRARTPLGLLRLDAAYPLDRRPGDDRYKVYVGFGNAF